MALKIEKHLNHTNNTLILGEINGNVKKGIPSLRTALDSVVTWDSTIAELFGNDDLKRLLAKDTNEVMRIFQPAYYFNVSNERVDGRDRIVVKHDSRFSENALEVPITTETLAFKILQQKGRVDPQEQIKQLRRLLDQGRNDYLAAVRSGNPKRMHEQKELRRRFISRLSEPVITYLMAAEACKNFIVREQDSFAGRGGADGEKRNVKLINIVKVENGEVKLGQIEVKQKEEVVIDVKAQEEDVFAGRKLKEDVRVGKRLLGGVVSRILDTEDVQALTAPEQRFLKAVVDTGVSSEVMVDHVELESKSYKLLSAQNQENIKLLAASTTESNGEAKDEAAEATEGGEEAAEATAEGDAAEAEATDEKAAEGSDSTALMSPEDVQKLRDTLDPSDLLENVEIIQEVALMQYEGDNDSQDKIMRYLHTVTPVGRKENEIAKIRKKRRGEAELRGEKGFNLYLDLCMLEATEQSPLIGHFEAWIRKALLGEPFELENKDAVVNWKRHHDKVLQTAEAVFDDYMNEVAPVITQLMGIDTFFKTANQTIDRKPHVLIANVPTEDFVFDDDLREKFQTLVQKMNDINQEEFERAISVVVAPDLDSVGADNLLKIAEKEGFCVVLSPLDIVDYDKLNHPDEVQNLIDVWAKDDPRDTCFQSAVLAVPDTELLPKEFKFILGQYMGNPKKSIFETSQSISVRACFNAAGLIVRNDDTKFVEKYLRSMNKKVQLESKWPSVSLDFNDERFEPIWESDALSEGVISRSNLESRLLPFCVFEHSKDKKGQYNKQRIAFLNTLFFLGDSPVPLFEYRQSKYLTRALSLNFPRGARANEIEHLFGTTYAGFYREGMANSILDTKRYEVAFSREDARISVKRKGGEDVLIGIDVLLEENTDDN